MEQKIIFKISKDLLLSHLTKVCRAVQDKVTIPVYAYVLFEIVDKKLHLTGTDSELQIQSSLELYDLVENTSFCVDKSIVGILKTLPEHPLEFEITRIPNEDAKKEDSIQIKIKHSSGEISIAGLDARNYIKMKSVDGKSFEMPVSNLSRGLSKTKKFASTDGSRPNVCVVYFDIQKDNITFASTNGLIVAKFIDKSLKDIEADSFLLRINAANQLASLLDATKEEKAKVTVSNTNVLFEFGETQLTSRLQEGRFVNYNSVFQKELPISFTADTKMFYNAVNRLLLTSGSYSLIRLDVDLSGVYLSSKDITFNKSSNETLQYLSCEGQIAIGVKGTQLQEMLSVMDGNVILYSSDTNKPLQMKLEKQEDDTDYTLLVVPLSLDL